MLAAIKGRKEETCERTSTYSQSSEVIDRGVEGLHIINRTSVVVSC